MKKKDCPRKGSNIYSNKNYISDEESKSSWRKLVSATVLAAAAVISFSTDMPAFADLNKFEAATRGEFGIGSAAQFGSADLRYFFFLRILICPCFLKHCLLFGMHCFRELGCIEGKEIIMFVFL